MELLLTKIEIVTYTFMFPTPRVPFGSAPRKKDEMAIAPSSAKTQEERRADRLLNLWYILCILDIPELTVELTDDGLWMDLWTRSK